MRLGFGAMRITGEGIWGEPRRSAPPAARCCASVVERGVNLIDTADSYGPEVSENLIAEALRAVSRESVIATKGGLERPGPGRWEPQLPPRPPEALLRGIAPAAAARADRPLSAPHGRPEGADRGLDRRAGRAAGGGQDPPRRRVQRHASRSSSRAQQIVPIVSVQNRYNVADRASEEVLARVRARAARVPAVVPARHGRRPRRIAARRWTRSPAPTAPRPARSRWRGCSPHSPVILPIPGTSSIAHFDENLDAGRARARARRARGARRARARLADSAQDQREPPLERVAEPLAHRALLRSARPAPTGSPRSRAAWPPPRAARASAGRTAARGRPARPPPRACSARRWPGSRAPGSRRRGRAWTAAGCATPGTRRSSARPGRR